MIRRPPNLTPTYTRFPYTTLFRSRRLRTHRRHPRRLVRFGLHTRLRPRKRPLARARPPRRLDARSEEHTSELQSLMRSSYDVFCLKKKTKTTTHTITQDEH